METFTTGQVARELGVSEPRLQTLMRFGKVPRPARLVRGKRVWTKAERNAARDALARNRAEAV